MGLWRATVSFLDYILDGEKTSHQEVEYQNRDQYLLLYATNYIQQMLVAAGFALLKLLRSFFSNTIDFNRGRDLFHRTIRAIRTTSVVQNDLYWRLAELMVQIWNGARLDGHTQSYTSDDQKANHHPVDDSLQLKVRCRHSMSLVFDSIWHWREEYQARGRGSLDASSTHLDSTLAPPSQPLPASLAIGSSNGALTPGGISLAGSQPNILGLSYDSSYDLWDSQHWMLDGLLDFNYTFGQPIEGA